MIIVIIMIIIIIKDVEVVRLVIGVLGSVSKRLEKWIEKLDLCLKIQQLQKTSLLGTAHILRKVLP